MKTTTEIAEIQDALPAVDRSISKATPLATAWGWLPTLLLSSGGGLLLAALAATGSRTGQWWAQPVFWAGVLTLLVPITTRLIGTKVARYERISLISVLVLGLYGIKVIHSPFVFTFSDEWIHVQNVNNILQDQRLFNENPLLPVTPLYPGLASMTSALVLLSGLPVFTAGVIVIGVARLVLALALYLLYERISNSARVAAVAVVFYTGNSNFMFWTAQYAYESLALPIAITTIYVFACRFDSTSDQRRVMLTITGLLCLATVIMTHHMSSYFLIAFFIIWSVILGVWRSPTLSKLPIDLIHWYAGDGPLPTFSSVFRATLLQLFGIGQQDKPEQSLTLRYTLGPPLLLTMTATIAWLMYVASYTMSYLSPVFSRAVASVIRLIIQEETGRQLFRASSGAVAPLWERVTGLGSVVLVVLGLPFGLWIVWQRLRTNPLALVLSVVSLMYFPLQAMRFTSAGWELSNRAAEFLFVGIALLLALAAVRLWLIRHRHWYRNVLLMMYVSVIVVGGVLVGWSPNVRLSQPYLIQAENALIEPPGAAAARWARLYLGPNHRVATDQANARFMLVYGEQYPLTGAEFGLQQMMQSEQFGKTEEIILEKIAVDYVVVDQRRISWDNMAGYYFNRKDTDPNQSKELFNPRVWQKFDNHPYVNRVFDNGNVIIYDVAAISSSVVPK